MGSSPGPRASQSLHGGLNGGAQVCVTRFSGRIWSRYLFHIPFRSPCGALVFGATPPYVFISWHRSSLLRYLICLLQLWIRVFLRGGRLGGAGVPKLIPLVLGRVFFHIRLRSACGSLGFGVTPPYVCISCLAQIIFVPIFRVCVLRLWIWVFLEGGRWTYMYVQISGAGYKNRTLFYRLSNCAAGITNK